MRVKGFTSLLAAAVLAALAGWTTVEPISTGPVCAGCARAVDGERCRARGGASRSPGAGPRTWRAAADPGRRPVCSRWPSICSRPRTSTRTGRIWLDKRYYRCNDSRELYSVWDSGRIGPSRRSPRRGATATTTGARAHRQPLCLQDGEGTLRGAASPRPRRRAARRSTRRRPCPTGTATTPATTWPTPVRSGSGAWRSCRPCSRCSRLEYQKRLVQTAYHEAVSNAPQWSASFCWPEGFTRWWSQPSQAGNFQLTMTPWNVQFLSGIADNFLRQVMVGKAAHVQKVPQWYGETIGFWDGTTLVTWTANIQAWQLSHVMFENSEKLETVETFKPGARRRRQVHRSRSRDDLLRPRRVRAGSRVLSLRAPGDDRRDVPIAAYIHRVPEQHLQHRRPPKQVTAPTRASWTTTAVRGRRTGKSIREGLGQAQDDLPSAITDIFK